MSTKKVDEREFKRSYFALRAWLILCSVLVLAAPITVLIVEGHLPRSISDSWHEGARMPFVFGLATASVLLLVVVGDTLFEHVMLKAAGIFGLVVASVPCWPKKPNGDKLCHYPHEVAHEAVVTVGVLLVVGLLGFAAALWLADRLDESGPGEDWKPEGRARALLMAVCPTVWLFYAVWFVVARYGLVHTVHFGSAVAMFACLALVAVARTEGGLDKLEEWLGDTPVDRGSSTIDTQHRRAAYNTVYTCIAWAVPVALGVAFVLAFFWSYWVLAVEFTMLAIFAVFWVTQTLEALGGLERKKQSSSPPAA